MIQKFNRCLFILLIVILMLSDTIILKSNIISICSILLMGALFIANIIFNKKVRDKTFFRKNLLIFIFLLIHFILIIIFKLSYKNLSVLFNEIFYLLTIYLLVIDDKSQIKKFLKVIIQCNLIINSISLVTGFLSLYGLLDFNAFYNQVNLNGLYTNTNGAGITTAICLILYFCYFFDKKDLSSYLLIIINLLFLYFFNCRTAILVIPFFLILYFIIKFFPTLISYLLKLFGVALFLFFSSYYGYMYINKDKPYLNKYETKIDSILTYRYILSKYSLLGAKDHILIGIDNDKIAEERFKNIPETMKREMEYSKINLLCFNGHIHNSYTQIIVNQGLIVFILFMLIIIQEIKKTKIQNLPVLFSILIISFFESKLLISKSLIMVIFMILLADHSKENYDDV